MRARWRGALAGVLAGGVAVGVGQLIAGIAAPNGSPVVVVGQLQIDLTPPWLKNFAISSFGAHDKQVLVGGILFVLAVLTSLFGALGTRRLRYGVSGFAVLASIGVVAASTRPNASAGIVLPTLVAFPAGVFALIQLLRAAGAARSPVGPAAVLDRRRFLLLSGSAAGAAAVSGFGGRLLAERLNVSDARAAVRLPAAAFPVNPLPRGVDLHIPGLASFVTPNSNFYRVDTALLVPQVPPATWRLRIHGMVRREIVLDFHDLLRRPLLEDYITLCCVSNPVGGPYIGNAKWLGASLPALLRAAGIEAGADQLYCTSTDGFTSGVPVATVMDGRDAMLAVGMNGQPLPVNHGFPVRMVVPGLYGYVSACKWLTDIEVTTYAANAAFWVQHGWAPQAPIKTESRIDVPSGLRTLHAGRSPVAGVAWAQHKGIAAVEVRIDRGAWQSAQLAAVPGLDTWRQWVWEWEAPPGNHLIEARATDETGYTQTAVQAPPEPNGASGYPNVVVTVQ